MKKVFFTLLFASAIATIGSAFGTDVKHSTSAGEPVLTILATKDGCTVTTTCSNGSSISCTGATCGPCTDIIIGALQGGFCNQQ